ncbi:MAG: DUF6519 domain-containing protein, partial [Desulfobacterales bacterium]|nr:DUF6519 domain-containing protein [Desulfobacterales bacterium]
MKGDFSRLTFDKTKHYRSTRLQQGRVSVDADWNEESDIANYRLDTETTDIIGCCGAPIYHSGFHIVTDTTQLTAEELDLDENDSPDPLADPADFYISGGRIYVGGRLVENERIIAYTLQPELPQLKPVVDPGVYLAYLDVWDRHITALEDPDIREVALGGPDTATRIKNTWQVKLLRIGDDDDSDSLNCLSEVKGLYTEPSGQLTARSEPDGTSSNPCIVAPAAGYRRLENQLYRIEVHQGGTRNAATFKWSRDNGSVVARWESQNGNDISVSSVGRDKVLQFKAGMWVELIDDERILLGQAGTLVRIEMVNDRVLTLDTTTATDTFDIADFGTNKKVRRWDSIEVLDPSGSGWYDIEDGVQVKFSSGTYNVGDYWMIPARTNIGDILWPKQGTTWQAVSPHGTAHAICRLAIMTFDGTTWASIDDCRPIFVPLKDMIQFDYIGGDGQEAIPGDQLDRPIQVGVARGSHPVANARVRFRRMSTTGSLSSSSGMTEESGSAQQRIVLTDDEGMARVNWRLGGPTSPVTQTVRAELLAVDDTRLHLPIHFNARLSIASQVWFDNSNCQTFSGGDTVQYAIDTMAGQAKLIRYGGEGQNARPGEVVPCPLQIIVANVCGPVANARVVFNPDGKGRVAVNPSALPSATPASVIVQTDATGLAQVYWQLDPDPDRICQHV